MDYKKRYKNTGREDLKTLIPRSVSFHRFLHTLIAWSTATFGDRPADIVEGILSLVRLAVQAIGGIGRFDFFVNGFINARGAECDTRTIEHGRTFRHANVRIANRQM